MAVLLTLVISSTASAQTTIVQHLGDNDPLAESPAWAACPGTACGGIVGGVGGAWQINTVGQTPARQFYAFNLTGVQVGGQDWFDLPWRLTMNVKVDATTGGSDAGFKVADAGQWQFNLLTDKVEFGGDDTVNIPYSSGAFHTILLQYDPVTDSADLSVDAGTPLNILRSQISTGGTGDVNWGDFNGGGGSTHSWTEVTFEVPEPSTGLLLMFGLGMLGLRGCRRR